MESQELQAMHDEIWRQIYERQQPTFKHAKFTAASDNILNRDSDLSDEAIQDSEKDVG